QQLEPHLARRIAQDRDEVGGLERPIRRGGRDQLVQQRLRDARGPAKKAGLEDRGAARSNEPRRPAAAELSGDELARLRSLPRVREVLATFRGRIEKVRVKEDG
ncbi:MAG: hypothetical protein ACYSUM_22800, partial [Planctomycetota bacterium]